MIYCPLAVANYHRSKTLQLDQQGFESDGFLALKLRIPPHKARN